MSGGGNFALWSVMRDAKILPDGWGSWRRSIRKLTGTLKSKSRPEAAL